MNKRTKFGRVLRGGTLTKVIWLAALVMSPGFAAAAEDNDRNAGWFIPANTPVKNFYVGARIGPGWSNFPNSNQDGSVTGTSTSGTAFMKGAFFGYQFGDYVAVEGSYTDFGQTDFKGTSSGGPSWMAGPVRATNNANAWEVGVWGRWPVAPRWYAIGYLGWSFWKSKETYYEGNFVSVENNSGGNVVYAVGAEWDVGLQDRIVYRFVGAQRQIDKSSYEVNTAMAEIVYRFP